MSIYAQHAVFKNQFTQQPFPRPLKDVTRRDKSSLTIVSQERIKLNLYFLSPKSRNLDQATRNMAQVHGIGEARGKHV